MRTGSKNGIIVVAGTDTEIGKTTATCALLTALRQAGKRALGIKPVESGTAVQPNSDAEDGRRLARATGQISPSQAFQRLKAPLAPPVAARDEGVELDPESWLDAIRDMSAVAEFTFVEGAGGLLSPLADGFNTRDLAIALDASVLLVAVDKLGTLNHTMLTLEALHVAGINVAGVIFSAPEIPDESTGRNAEVIAERYPRIPVTSLPRIESDEQGADILRPWLLKDDSQ